MSAPIEDGGPAFLHDRGGPYKQMWSGISVRDYFAAAAMQGICAGSDWRTGLSDEPDPPAEEIASDAYEMADAMLKARQS